MKTDVEIAMNAYKEDIRLIANKLNIDEEDIELYGKYKAKLKLDLLDKRKNKEDGKLILVTAINPTPAGEGKTTVNIGLSMGLNKIGKKAISTLREPSLGPSFGVKGGAAGGGYSQVLPMEDINLHFTGDMHAITSANNLIAAMLDNHLHQGNKLRIDPRRILWKRCLDLNDRSLRKIVIGLGGKGNSVPREDSFNITVASEMMAILCLSENLQDLKRRVGNIILAYNYEGKPVYAREINCQGPVALLMKDAIKPNLVQTIENTPAIIHGGPFANIAHGCNSLIATKMSLKLADYVVTEAGFGADLGCEKFFDIKCRLGDLKADCVVLVATVRALKMHGGKDLKDLESEDLSSLEKGFENLRRHIENIKGFGMPVVVALNSFPSDTEREVNLIKDLTEEMGVNTITTDLWLKGGSGALDLAKEVVDLCERSSCLKLKYEDQLPIKDKISAVCKEVYGAKDVEYVNIASRKISEFEDLGFGHLPICIAKTQYSFSDDKDKLGAPEDFKITISDVEINAGAGFIVVLTGNIMRMPGLPKKPAAESIDILDDGEIVGLF